MVTKGIITSIDFNGNTCQVRIPLFETAGNDPITGTAIVSNTPGSYNGYKVGDVVLVAFEDGKMQNPVIVGKLYLGAAKEKQDPRGTINVETTTASKSASLPADAVLTANVDSNVPNTNTPFGSLASIANNLNSLNTDVNQLDRFTRNQFNSVITDVNDQGEQLRSEIKQTASNIEANVVHKHQDGSQNALGWDLTTDSWKINAQDTVNGKVKDINIVTIDRSGMSIAGDLKLNGYPKNIVVRYAQNGSDTKYPNLYNFKPDSFPDAEIDKTWYYNKYIKIIEADKEKYILISSENIDDYTIIPGETVAYVYNLEEINTEWKTETPARVDGQYIWQWTHTESFLFNGDSWDEKDDDKVVCITGAKGETGKNGADGKPGDSIYTISIDNDFDSVPADVNGNVSSNYPWESETKHNVRVYYGKEAQDFTIVDQNGTASSTGLCIKYKLTNVTLGNTPSVNDKVATAWIKALSADTGNILYTLYVDGVEIGITGKFSATKIKSPAPTYTISIDNDFATIPTSIVNNKIYRNASNKFVPAASGYNRETITVAGTAKKLPGMKLSAVTVTKTLKDALLQTPAELITGTNKSYVEDITKHNVTVYCNDDVETITADNFIVKLDSDGLDTNMDTTQNYLVCELGGFDSTGARATDFPGMNPAVNNNVVTNYITALSALGDTGESKNVYIQYTYYVKGELVATAKFEVTRHTGPTTYYLSSNVSTIKVNKNVSPATITPDTVTCTAYRLDTSTNTNTRFTNGTWKYKWDNGTWSPDTSTASDLKISTADVITNKYKQLYIELYLDNQLWDRETIDVIADGENAIDYKILVDNGQIKRDPNDHTEDTSSVTFSFYKWNGSTRSNFNGAHFNYYINGVGPTPGQCSGSTNTFTVNADSNPAISSITKNIKVELLDKQNGTVVESETIDVVVNGSNGLYITNTKQWYKLVANGAEDPKKPTTDIVGTDENGNPTHTTNEGWSDIPLDAINDMNLWTSLESIFSDDTPEKRHIEFSDPVKDAAYALAQGKTTNYYSPTEPIYNVKKGDCWFDTGYVKIDTPTTKTDYLGKFIVSTTGNISVKADETDSTRYIPDAAGSTKLIKITPDNIDKGLFTVKTKDTAGTDAYETGNLKQWDGETWIDLAGESVTNKLTAKYINALDITAKKITVLDKSNNNEPLFEADGINGNGSVKIANFNVNQTGLYSGTHNHIGSTDDGVYLGVDGISIGSNFKVKAGSVIISDYTKSTIKKYRKIEYDNETEAAAKYTDWTNWDSDKWLSTIPGRDNGLYIWEWTKEEKGNGKFVDLGRVCITGAKGDPGEAGANPHVGENGNWWIGDSDTGVKAEGADGHTPVITIGENGNWYIDGKDTGVLAKGTPGEPGAQGIGISECKTYYSLSNTTSLTGPETGDSNIVDTPAVNKWSESPQAFDKNTHQGYEYWTVERRVYTNGAVVWGTPVKASMLSIDFIDSLGITAKKLLVTNSNGTLLDAGWSDDNMVTIGGFTVDSNRLYAGNPGTDDSIEIAKVHNLIAYKSNNQGVASSRAVSKITVNKDITNLTVYIRSYAESNFDYTMISNPNVSSYPTAYSSSDVKAHTRSNQNSSSALTGYTKVEYYDLKQNDYIYIVYSKDISNNAGADTGYFLIPETAVISIETVNGTGYTFERDTSLDIKEAGASLKVGSNFSVDSTGAIKSTSGTIGKLAIDGDGLSYGSTFKIDPTVDSWGSSEKQKATVVASSTLVQNTLVLPGQSKRYYDEVSYYWPAFDREGFKILYTADWTGTDKPYKLGEYDLWDLAGIPIVSNYDHSMTRAESLACFGNDRSETMCWGSPIIYANRHINIGSDWVEVDLSSSFNGSIRKILTVVCTTYVQPTKNTNSTSTTPTSKPNQSGNLFVSYDDYSNGKFWIRSDTDAVTVSILAIGVPAIAKTY